ncbi:hypothetical protein CBL_11064 [Carabus blaptoides fortunei]
MCSKNSIQYQNHTSDWKPSLRSLEVKKDKNKEPDRNPTGVGRNPEGYSHRYDWIYDKGIVFQRLHANDTQHETGRKILSWNNCESRNFITPSHAPGITESVPSTVMPVLIQAIRQKSRKCCELCISHSAWQPLIDSQIAHVTLPGHEFLCASVECRRHTKLIRHVIVPWVVVRHQHQRLVMQKATSVTEKQTRIMCQKSNSFGVNK